MIEVITYFISLAALLIGGFYLIINCNSTFNYFPSECQFCGRISKTNADRIREMDDEELADFLLGVPMRFMAGDWYSIRNWLKQEVE